MTMASGVMSPFTRQIIVEHMYVHMYVCMSVCVTTLGT